MAGGRSADHAAWERAALELDRALVGLDLPQWRRPLNGGWTVAQLVTYLTARQRAVQRALREPATQPDDAVTARAHEQGLAAASAPALWARRPATLLRNWRLARGDVAPLLGRLPVDHTVLRAELAALSAAMRPFR